MTTQRTGYPVRMEQSDDISDEEHREDITSQGRVGEEQDSAGSSLPPGSSSREDEPGIAGNMREERPYDDGDPSGKLSPGAPNPAPE